MFFAWWLVVGSFLFFCGIFFFPFRFSMLFGLREPWLYIWL
jgi:hypothetical protein